MIENAIGSDEEGMIVVRSSNKGRSHCGRELVGDMLIVGARC